MVYNDIENEFLLLEGKGKNLIAQPHVVNRYDYVVWTPDFLDTLTNTYYEVVGNRQSFYAHKNKKHFDYMLKNNLKLIIATYIKPVYVNFARVKDSKFILREYTEDFVLMYDEHKIEQRRSDTEIDLQYIVENYKTNKVCLYIYLNDKYNDLLLTYSKRKGITPEVYVVEAIKHKLYSKERRY